MPLGFYLLCYHFYSSMVNESQRALNGRSESQQSCAEINYLMERSKKRIKSWLVLDKDFVSVKVPFWIPSFETCIKFQTKAFCIPQKLETEIVSVDNRKRCIRFKLNFSLVMQ